MKTLKRLFRIIRVTWWRFNNDFKHWNQNKVKSLLFACLIACTTILKAQPKITIEKFDDNAAHVYAGMAINLGVGAFIYKKTNKPFPAILGGFLAGVAAGWAKEKVYDGIMHKGVDSNRDGWNTTWGSAVGVFILGAGINMHQTKQRDREYFEALNDSLSKRMFLPDSLITINLKQ